MTSEIPTSPRRCANDISRVLRHVLGEERFPVNIEEVAQEISQQKFPDDPISMIRGDSLPGFEGALMPAPPGKSGWGIVYNNDVASRGRINFTLAHEFGHYMLHRLKYPKGMQCTTEDMTSWDSEYQQIEHQANQFAATLLMPLDDFRRQIDDRRRPDFDELGACADRYDVSLMAAILQWLEFTTSHSQLVVSRSGYILWARSSKRALKRGLFYKTRNRPPLEVPSLSLAAQPGSRTDRTGHTKQESDVWLGTPCSEHVLFSDQYDVTLSLLHFSEGEPKSTFEDELEEDVVDRMKRRMPGPPWS